MTQQRLRRINTSLFDEAAAVLFEQRSVKLDLAHETMLEF